MNTPLAISKRTLNKICRALRLEFDLSTHLGSMSKKVGGNTDQWKYDLDKRVLDMQRAFRDAIVALRNEGILPTYLDIEMPCKEEEDMKAFRADKER